MTIRKDLQKSAYDKLSFEVKDFIMSAETTDFIQQSINEAGLSSEISRSAADGEIFSALLGLQNLNDAINNIAKTESKSPADLASFQTSLEKRIFEKLYKIKGISKEEATAINNIDTQTVTNAVQSNQINNSVPPPPTSQLPKENNLEDRKSVISVPNYSDYESGKDPYREPIE